MGVIIISGGIGSGKSTVCEIFNAQYGWPVYEADNRVKELYLQHDGLLNDIESALGESFRDEKGVFMPSSLAARIFMDNKALETVESYVFPVLMDDFLIWRKINADKEYVILESATILEKPQLRGIGDCVVVVDAPIEVRVERAAFRGQTTKEVIRRRIGCQPLMNSISEGSVPEGIDFIIKNDSDLEQLAEEVNKAAEMIMRQNK